MFIPRRRGMLKAANRKEFSMKRRLFLVLIAALLLFCACQPTPESSIIVGKDQQQMIEKAQETAIYASPDASVQKVDWYARLGAPEQYTTTLKSAGGRLTVEVDADVILPSAELPIVHVVPRSFSDEDAQRIVKALWGNDPQCIEWTGKNRTKAMCDRLIPIWKDALDHWEDYGSLAWDIYDTKEDWLRSALAPKTMSMSIGNETDLPIAAYAFIRLLLDDKVVEESLVAAPIPLKGLFWM